MNTNLSTSGFLFIAVGLAWVLLAARFLFVFSKPEKRRELLDSPIHWAMWAIALFIVLSGTTEHPAVKLFFEEQIGGWFATVPRTLFGLLLFMFGPRICFRMLPPYRVPRWNWPLYTGGLVFVAYVSLLWAADSGSGFLPFDVGFYRDTAGDSLFHFFVLLATVHTILPALIWLRVDEKHVPMRLQLSFLILMYQIFVVWMVNALLQSFSIALGWAFRPLDTLYPLIVGGFAVAFMAAFFAPPPLYRRLAKWQYYFSNLSAFILLRIVEMKTCRYTASEPSSIGLREAVGQPDAAVYRSTIAILDARKLLKLQASHTARRLGNRLDLAAKPDITYSQVVARLRRIGMDFLIRGEWASV